MDSLTLDVTVYGPPRAPPVLRVDLTAANSVWSSP